VGGTGSAKKREPRLRGVLLDDRGKLGARSDRPGALVAVESGKAQNSAAKMPQTATIRSLSRRSHFPATMIQNCTRGHHVVFGPTS
jgi:hypothetical protein